MKELLVGCWVVAVFIEPGRIKANQKLLVQLFRAKSDCSSPRHARPFKRNNVLISPIFSLTEVLKAIAARTWTCAHPMQRLCSQQRKCVHRTLAHEALEMVSFSVCYEQRAWSTAMRYALLPSREVECSGSKRAPPLSLSAKLRMVWLYLSAADVLDLSKALFMSSVLVYLQTSKTTWRSCASDVQA